MSVQLSSLLGGVGPLTSSPLAPVDGRLAFFGLTSRACAQDEGEWTDAKTSQIRRITAQRLLESKTTIPHYYLTVECSVDKLLQMRSQLNSRLAADGKKLSVNDFIIKASALVSSWPAQQQVYVPCMHSKPAKVSQLLQSSLPSELQQSGCQTNSAC